MIGTPLIILLLTIYACTTNYPSCDNPNALRALANLYDNKRLLRATDVQAARLLRDGLQGRYCAARVTWADGSQSDVRYMYLPLGRGQRTHSLWIDYNK